MKNLRSPGHGSSTTSVGGPDGDDETTPIMVNGILYFTAGQRRNVIAAECRHGRNAVDLAAR